MKKHSLLKTMGIVLLLLVVLTYFIPARAGAVSYLPFGDIITNYIQSYYYFFDTVVFMIIIGAFYGVLNKTGAYKKLLDSIVKKAKPASKKFIFTTIIVFAVVASLTGLTLPLLVFVPFVISIILLLGYDKLVAISSTVVAILVGFVGGLFVTFRDPNAYSYTLTTFERFVGIDDFTNLLPHLLILLLGIGLLIMFVKKHIDNVEAKKVKYELNDNSGDILITEVKGNYKDIKTWPLITVLSVLFVLLVLGLVPWNSLFKIEVFTKFHESVTGLNIKDFTIFTSIISSIFPAFGSWGELGNYMMVMVIMLIALLIIKFVYKVKFDDMLDGMVEGAKKMLPTAMLLMVAYTVLVCTYNNGFIETLITNASKNGDINFALAILINMFGSLLHVDLYYTVAGVFTPVLKAISDDAMLAPIALSFQSLYGLISIIGPTSLMLIFALSYLDVPYTTWLKYIWRFILTLFILIIAVLLIIALI